MQMNAIDFEKSNERINKIVYLGIEVKKRELTGKCLLAAVLAKRGYTVVLCHKLDARYFASTNLPGIFIDKDYTEHRSKDWKSIIANDSMVYAWDEEGIEEVFPYEFELRTGKTSIEMAKGIFLWGDAQLEMIKQFGVDESKMHIVGNPRMDLLGDNLKYFYETEANKNVQKYGKYILVNLNFCLDEGVGKWTDILAMEAEKTLSESVEAAIDERFEQSRNMVNIYCELIEELSSNLPYTIIVRPHPGEKRVDWWKKRFCKYDNVVVNREGDANCWMYGAIIMIHPGCTTALEAYISRIPTITYNPIEDYSVPVFSELSKKANSMEDVVSIVKDYIDGKCDESVFFDAERDDLIGKHILLSKDKTSCERIADIFDQHEYINKNVEFTVKESFKMRIWHYRRLIAHLRGRDVNDKFEYTYTSEIKKAVKASCQKMDYDYSNMRIKWLGANRFEITYKK